jgi:hypothetical protein
MSNQLGLNASLLVAGDKVHYSDASNFITYEVTDVFDDGFEVKNINKDCPIEHQFECHFFADMQYGWSVSELSMLRIENNWTML